MTVLRKGILYCLPLFRTRSSSRVCLSQLNMSSVGKKPKVFVTRSDFPQSGIDIIKNRYDVEIWDNAKGFIKKADLLKHVKGVDALYISLNEKIDKDVFKAAGPSLKVIATMSVGVDHVDLKETKARNVKLGYTPGVLTEATAELTVALLLATSRRLFEANKQILINEWKSWAPTWMCGPALRGAIVGIVGLGRIGTSVAHKLAGFSVGKIYYSARSEKPEVVKNGWVYKDLDTLLKESDFVVATCALTEKTKNLFNKERISMMKPTAIFINTARGGIVDQDALLEALKTGKIRAAGLDVCIPEPLNKDHPLLKLDNCIVLPHIGSATYQARMVMAELTSNNIVAALSGNKLPAEYPV